MTCFDDVLQISKLCQTSFRVAARRSKARKSQRCDGPGDVCSYTKQRLKVIS